MLDKTALSVIIKNTVTNERDRPDRLQEIRRNVQTSVVSPQVSGRQEIVIKLSAAASEIYTERSVSCRFYMRASTGFDGGFEVWEAIRRLRNCVIKLELKFKRRRKLRVSSLSAACPSLGFLLLSVGHQI